jgi:AraC family transcriptional regulator of arabinose operon
MDAPIFLFHKTIIMIPRLLPYSLVRPRIYHCEKEWRWRPGPLRDFDLWAVLSGSGEMVLGRQTISLHAGTCFLFQPGDSPAGRHDPDEPLLVFACHFQIPGAHRKSPRVAPDLIHARLRQGELLRQSSERAVQVFEEGRTGRQAAAALVEQIVAQIFHARAHPENSSASNPLSQLALEIRSRPSHPWQVAAMARRCSLSAPHFNRRFRQQFGHSPLRYVILARVARAITLLRESDLPLIQVAELTGYNDVFFFHRQFRQIAGTTPRAVRLGHSTRLDELPRKN